MARFIERLRDEAGFESWAEFGRAAGGFSAEQMSDWSRGENAPSGYNLLSLIWAAEREHDQALRRAALATDPNGAEVKIAAYRELVAALDQGAGLTADLHQVSLSATAAELIAEIREHLNDEFSDLDARLARLEAAQAQPAATRARKPKAM